MAASWTRGSLSGHRGGSLTLQSGQCFRDHKASCTETAESSDSPVLPNRDAPTTHPHASRSLLLGGGGAVCSLPSPMASEQTGSRPLFFSVFFGASTNAVCLLFSLQWFQPQ